MGAVTNTHQPQNSLTDSNITTDGAESKGEEGLLLWKTDPVKIKKETVYKFGFELTIPKALHLCYYTPNGTRKAFTEGQFTELQSIYIH